MFLTMRLGVRARTPILISALLNSFINVLFSSSSCCRVILPYFTNIGLSSLDLIYSYLLHFSIYTAIYYSYVI